MLKFKVCARVCSVLTGRRRQISNAAEGAQMREGAELLDWLELYISLY